MKPSPITLHFSNKDETKLDSLEVQKLATLLGYLQSAQFELFLNQSFTGIYPEDDILTLLRLMTSKQPGTNLHLHLIWRVRSRISM